jgi:hypothetical protein
VELVTGELSMKKGTIWHPSREVILDIRLRLKSGEFQHHIAADYGINQGRIS